VVRVVDRIVQKVHNRHFDCQRFGSLVGSIVRTNSRVGEEGDQAYKYEKSRNKEPLMRTANVGFKTINPKNLIKV
jgi:hypothetical protein